MGTYTTNYNLYMPSIGEQGWGELVNGNFATIDITMKGLDTRVGTLETETAAIEGRVTTLEAGDIETINGDLYVNVTSIENNSVGSCSVLTQTSTKTVVYGVGGTFYGEPIIVGDMTFNMKKGFAAANNPKINTPITLVASTPGFSQFSEFGFYIYVNNEIVYSKGGGSGGESSTHSTKAFLAKGDVVTCSLSFSSNYGSGFQGTLTLTVGDGIELPLYLA